MLKRNSVTSDRPRILGAFNEETPDWLSFFMFTYFTDRDGKYQLASLKESASIPWRGPASSCSRRRPTTCSSAPPAWQRRGADRRADEAARHRRHPTLGGITR